MSRRTDRYVMDCSGMPGVGRARVGAVECAAPPERVPLLESTMFRFYIARARYDAFLVADRLNQAGIRAHVFNQHAQSIVGDVPPDVAQPQVWLEREADRERAQILLARLAEEAAQAGSRRCAACGEESPANFDLCWNCGKGIG